MLARRMLSEAGVWGKAGFLHSPHKGLPAESFVRGRTHVPEAQSASDVPAPHLGTGSTAAGGARWVGEDGCSVRIDGPRSAPFPQAGAACGASPRTTRLSSSVPPQGRSPPPQTIPTFPAGTGGRGSSGINVLSTLFSASTRGLLRDNT